MNDDSQSTLPSEKPALSSLTDHPKPDDLGQKSVFIEQSSSTGRTTGLNSVASTHAETVSLLKKNYQLSKRRKGWLKVAGVMVAVFILLGGIGAWLWGENQTFKMAMIKAISPIVTFPLEPVMVSIPAGKFRQGDLFGNGIPSEVPVREVHIKKFALGRMEVTFEEFDRFAMATGQPFPRDEGWGRGKRPVINISWEDAVNYAKWLSKETGRRYRLPTESEWEFAARNGGKEEIWAGTSNQDRLSTYAWFNVNSTGRTQSVGGRKANGLGLQDMSGNVWEWVEDCWHNDYENAPTNGSAWLTAKNGNCGLRVRRGGSWTNAPMSLRTSLRNGYSADSRSIQIGFRLAREVN